MSVIRLSRDYTCVQGAPVIHSVDDAIFSLRYFTRCMACTFCKDGCCDHGVDIDVANRDRLLADEAFAARIPVPREAWFTADVVADPEFPSGAYVRTATRNGVCVFRAPDRGCAIHAYAMETGIDYHLLKPMVSTPRNMIIDQKPNRPILPKDTAHGNRKATSRSKMMKRMATR